MTDICGDTAGKSDAENKLKPCPFCGDDASLNWDNSRFWVQCTYGVCFISGPKRPNAHLAKEAWNTRAIKQVGQ